MILYEGWKVDKIYQLIVCKLPENNQWFHFANQFFTSRHESVQLHLCLERRTGWLTELERTPFWQGRCKQQQQQQPQPQPQPQPYGNFLHRYFTHFKTLRGFLDECISKGQTVVTWMWVISYAFSFSMQLLCKCHRLDWRLPHGHFQPQRKHVTIQKKKAQLVP